MIEEITQCMMKEGIEARFIRKEYRIILSGGFKFIADIAIADDYGVIKAVIEMKERENIDALKIVKQLHVAIDKRFACFLVTKKDEMQVWQIIDVDNVKELSLDNMVCLIKELMFSENGVSQIDSVSKFLEQIKNEQDLFKNDLEDSAISEECKSTVKFLYRGESVNYGDGALRPSLFRKSGLSIDDFDGRYSSYYEEEQYLLYESERVFPLLFSRCNRDVDKLTIAQHYGIPTRLLDVTGNALVALYFAAQESDGGKKDGIVYMFGVSAKDYRLAAERGQSEDIEISRYHTEQTFCDRGKCPRLIFPVFKTDRQLAQDGSFYLFENSVNPFKVCGFKESDYRKLVIPNKFKKEILHQLEWECNIHRGTLFPESLSDYKEKIINDAQSRINALYLDKINTSRVQAGRNI